MMYRLAVIFPLILLFSSACSSTGNLSPTSITDIISTTTASTTITPTREPSATPTTMSTSTSTAIPILTNTLTPEPTEPPLPTPEPLIPISEITYLDHIPERSVQCIDERLCYHMRVKEDKQEEAWKQVISSFAVSPILEDYWKDLGVNEPNPESVEAFLSTSVGGPEESGYWLPSETPNGIPFVMLQGRTMVRAMFDKHKQINENGGVYLDRVGFAAFSVDDWKNNQEINEWVTNLMDKNYRGNPKYIDRGSSCYISNGTPHILFGLNFDMNRFIFIIGNERVIELIPEDQENLSLGGLDQSFRPDYDTKIAQAYWETYWTLTSEWDESLKYENQFLFITPGPGMPSPPIVSLFDIRETIFEPIE